MDHLRSLPVKSQAELPAIPVDERAAEVKSKGRLALTAGPKRLRPLFQTPSKDG